MTTQNAIIRCLRQFLAAFPNSRIDSGGLILYAKALSRYDVDEVEAAMIKLLQTSKFYPSVAEIIEAIGSLELYVQESCGGRKVLTAGEAWEEVMGYAKHIGYMKPWPFSTPEVEAAAKQYGKMELCSLLADDVGTARAQFCRFYEARMKQVKKADENRMALEGMGATKAKALIESLGQEVKMIE